MTTTVPTYDLFIEPVLHVLSEHSDGLRTKEIYELVADHVGLSAAQRGEILPSGRQAYYKNRIGWAFDRLKRAGFGEAISRGEWRLTGSGLDFLESRPQGLSDQDLSDLANVERDDLALTRLGQSAPGGPTGAQQPREAPTQVVDRRTPEETIEAALDELHRSVANELLLHVLESTPEFFERLVLDVLLAMGYGADHRALTHVGGSGDGGIDGIITLDRLGLEKVYIQAKRWALDKNVGRPDLQGFYGALASRKANKGVFLTTSSFSAPAREFAKQVSDGIVLVDGDMLTRLMIEFGVGISTLRTVKIVRVDTDYFEEG